MTKTVNAAIIDYGMGNLFSIKQACLHVGIEATVTKDKADIQAADIVILPGVGAFGSAMEELRKQGLDIIIKEAANTGKIIFGICLGMQLLFTKSLEFGEHEGLNLIPGTVNNLRDKVSASHKIPNIGWHKIKTQHEGGLLKSLDDEPSMYFVHSYYVAPDDEQVISSTIELDDFSFCASVQYQNIIGCQFHPEKSGERGLSIYRALKDLI